MLSTLRRLAKGQTILRILMNDGLRGYPVVGKVADVGGGHEPDYFDYFDMTGAGAVTVVDGSVSGIDFEEDALPFRDAGIDTVICANVLEHVYNHAHLVREMRRILSADGTVVGFVPFLLQYHPDPHDYFRYTKEALARIFTDAGFSRVEIRTVGGGPFLVNFNTIVLSFPRIARPLLYLPYALFDAVFLALRPKARERVPLGFIFTLGV